MKQIIYSDASFDKFSSQAVIGYAYFKTEEEHSRMTLEPDQIRLHTIHEKNNIRAELRGAIMAIRACMPKVDIFLYTDCQTVCGLVERRQKLEGNGFISQAKNQLLANADLYKEFYEVYDSYRPNIQWLKGHVSGADLTRVQNNFAVLDKWVRKNLRTQITALNK